MALTNENPARAGCAAGLGNVDLRAANDTRDTTRIPDHLQALQAPDVTQDVRDLRRDEVYDAAADAINYLNAIRVMIACDDVPGLRYSYAKFAAYGRVVALGCKALAAPEVGGAP